MPRRSPLAAAFTVLLSCIVAAPALAQDWPQPGRAIQLIVPAPGSRGTGDTTARVLAEEMQTRLKASFVIDNLRVGESADAEPGGAGPT